MGALEISRASEAEEGVAETDRQRPRPEEKVGMAAAIASVPQEQSRDIASSQNDQVTTPIMLELKASASCAGSKEQESLEVVLREFTVGEILTVPEQLRQSLEQISLRLTRENWLLFYESVAAEAQLRARTIAHLCRTRWLGKRQFHVRCCLDLEPKLLQLPIFGVERISKWAPTAALDFATTEHDEEQLASFVQAWEEYEAWTLSVVEHLGPLDLEVSRERTHNLQHGRS